MNESKANEDEPLTPMGLVRTLHSLIKYRSNALDVTDMFLKG